VKAGGEGRKSGEMQSRGSEHRKRQQQQVVNMCSVLPYIMDSPLGVPGELSGPLLVKRCIEV
jgi:hypothetical protein